MPPWDVAGLARWERVVAFLEQLPITAGTLAGERMRLRPWQLDIVRSIYGDGPRVVRTALLTFGRKNGKTALAAGLCLAHLCGPESEARGQVVSAAADREQSGIIFKEMRAIVDAEDWLTERVSVRSHNKDMLDEVTGSTYQALSSEVGGKHGLSCSFWVYDELAQAPDQALYDVLETSGGARAEPLGLIISTQSPDPLHIMSQLVDYGEKVRDGIIDDPTFYASVWRVPEPKDETTFDPLDEAHWPLANPALGDFRSLAEMRTMATRCREQPARLPAFRNLFLNMRTDARTSPWLSPQDIRRCSRDDIDIRELEGEECFAGLDLSTVIDLSSLALYFPRTGQALIEFWCPAETLGEREKVDKVPYKTWEKAGHITATPGRSIDKRSIALRLAKVKTLYRLQGVAYDRYGIDELTRILADEGIEVALEKWGQGFLDMSPAMKRAEADILSGKLTWRANPVMTWCLSNVVQEVDAAFNVKPSKRRSPEKIDGAVAMIMAVGLATRAPAKDEFIYTPGKISA